MYGLVDCNNFFASCERVFNPTLRNRPVVILSNNDGCIIARSNEAKALGIKMGTPFYQVKDLLERHDVAVYSSNYVLYGDMSRRVMTLLSGFTPNLSVYSIDEAFLDLGGLQDTRDLVAYGQTIVQTISRGTGIPVTLGVAPTKTLAKVASYFGKKYTAYHGVCIIDTDEKRQRALELTPIGEVWGIGRRLRPRLEQLGIHTAWDFVMQGEAWVRRKCALAGVRTWRELQGVSCIPEDDLPQKKSICTSRSFAGDGLEHLEQMEEALANFATACSEKLKRQHSCCAAITVFAYTSRFREDVPQDAIYENVMLQVPTNDQQEIINKLLEVGLLNDFVFAKAYASDKLYLSNYGPNKIYSDLKEHQIDDGIINQVISALSEDDIREKLVKLINKKIKNNHKYSNYILKQKVINELSFSGFSKDMIIDIFGSLEVKDNSNLEREYDKLYIKYSKKFKDYELFKKIKEKLYQKGFDINEINSFMNEKNND